jgi:hypothetical protein
MVIRNLQNDIPFLDEGQKEAVSKMKNGCILCGSVGSGKSRTAIAYFYLQGVKKLYIITTAKKRDTHEWEPELILYGMEAIIDSWNNIKKYKEIKGGYFIFDEQRVVGYGAWTKSFLSIAANNKFILLSATPGDTWMDYIPIFIANGFYRNKTDFVNQHVIYDRYSKFPRVDRYFGLERLVRLRDKILVDIDYHNPTEKHNIYLTADYDYDKYKYICRFRKNLETGEPIRNATEFCSQLRKVVNKDPSRLKLIDDIYKKNFRVIIFYNFDYELDLLLLYAKNNKIPVAEWNGHKHQPIPDTGKWLYLVQYNAGSEGWNCTLTDTIIFYSQSYSYKQMIQAAGRIDRRNTPYSQLYFYHITSKARIDMAITKSLIAKKKFNETKFCGKMCFQSS